MKDSLLQVAEIRSEWLRKSVNVERFARWVIEDCFVSVWGLEAAATALLKSMIDPEFFKRAI